MHMKNRSDRKGNPVEAEPPLGELLGEFPDVRAGPMRAVGSIVVLVGGCTLAAGFLPGWEPIRVLGVCLLVPGVFAFAVGAWRNENRVLVYSGGLIHKNGDVSSCYPWRD